jgi:hypothetical protein
MFEGGVACGGVMVIVGVDAPEFGAVVGACVGFGFGLEVGVGGATCLGIVICAVAVGC